MFEDFSTTRSCSRRYGYHADFESAADTCHDNLLRCKTCLKLIAFKEFRVQADLFRRTAICDALMPIRFAPVHPFDENAIHPNRNCPLRMLLRHPTIYPLSSSFLFA